MKVILTCMLLLFSSSIFAQAKDDQVSLIRQQVQEINSFRSLKKKTFENEEFLEQMTDGGGELTCYYKNGKLVKIIEWIGLSSCINITEYYIQNNNLIFVYVRGKEFEYKSSSATTIPKLTMECRFYFIKNKLIKSLLKGSTKCGGVPAKNWSDNYLDNYSRYTKLIHSSH